MRFSIGTVVRTLVCVVLSLFCGVFVWGKETDEALMRIPSSELLKRGNRFLYENNLPDSAMRCFTIVAERNRPGMSQREREECFAGWCGRWETNNWGFNNYAACVQDYERIIELQDSWGIESARPEYYLALYTLYESNEYLKEYTMEGLLELFRKAFRRACALKDRPLAQRIFDNMVRMPLSNAVYVPLGKDLAMLRRLFGHKSDTIRRSVKQYEVLEAIGRKDLEKAVGIMDTVISMYTQNARNARYICSALNAQAWFFYQLGRYPEAERNWDKAIGITYKFNRKDTRYSMIGSLAMYYNRIGDRKRYEEARRCNMFLKDSIWSVKITRCIQQMKFHVERREIRKEIALMQYRQTVLRWIIGVSAFVIIIFVLLVWWLVRSNRKLRERNRMLYNKALQEAVVPVSAIPPHDTCGADTVLEEKRDNCPERTDLMSPEAFDVLAAKIEDVLESDAIFDRSFSLTVLANLCGSNQKYVSHVVNRKFGCNFQTIVNRLRVREACRRIDNVKTYGHWSIEGIAESVGFNSRGAFCAAFKKFTGLGAGEYRKISHQRNR